MSKPINDAETERIVREKQKAVEVLGAESSHILQLIKGVKALMSEKRSYLDKAADTLQQAAEKIKADSLTRPVSAAELQDLEELKSKMVKELEDYNQLQVLLKQHQEQAQQVEEKLKAEIASIEQHMGRMK